jgi:hypothetical protein
MRILLGRTKFAMDISQIEALFGLRLPELHVRALLDLSDPIHEACDFLVLESEYELLRFDAVNAYLRDRGRWNPWPEHLVAFASNGCGDYFAYDLRSVPPLIIYIDPYVTVQKNLEAPDKLIYRTFDEWREAKLRRADDPPDQHRS